LFDNALTIDEITYEKNMRQRTSLFSLAKLGHSHLSFNNILVLMILSESESGVDPLRPVRTLMGSTAQLLAAGDPT
jgi:hypothetical protein